MWKVLLKLHYYEKMYTNKTIMDLYNKDKEFTSICIYLVVCAFIYIIIGLI